MSRHKKLCFMIVLNEGTSRFGEIPETTIVVCHPRLFVFTSQLDGVLCSSRDFSNFMSFHSSFRRFFDASLPIKTRWIHLRNNRESLKSSLVLWGFIDLINEIHMSLSPLRHQKSNFRTRCVHDGPLNSSSSPSRCFIIRRSQMEVSLVAASFLLLVEADYFHKEEGIKSLRPGTV